MKRIDKTARYNHLTRLLSALFTVCMMDSHLTKDVLEGVVIDAAAQARRDLKRLQAKQAAPVDLDVIGHVIYHWQRSARYLDPSGKPFPIPSHGPAPSIEALFRQLKVSKKFDTSFPQLRKYKRVRVTKGGLYFPSSETTIIPTLTPEVVMALTQTINRLVATVLQNTSARNRNSIRLIERSTWVPDLPKARLPEFKQFVREQAGGMLETVNDWLETRRGSVARKPNDPGRFEVGLHAFAFVEKQSK